MAYTPLSQRVRDRMAQIQGTAPEPDRSEAGLRETPQQVANEVRHIKPHKPEVHPVEPHIAEQVRDTAPKREPGFQWNTPDRVREMVRPQQKQQKRGGFGMTNAQIIRQLRKGKR